MVEEGTQLVDLGCACANFGLGAGNVFAILPASGVRTVSGSDKGEGVTNTVLLHLPDRVPEQGMPVAVSPIDGTVKTVVRELFVERRDQVADLMTDAAHHIENRVMLEYGE